MGGGLLEDAVVAAITAMNEPKTCSITILRKFLMEKQDQKNVSLVGTVHSLLTYRSLGSVCSLRTEFSLLLFWHASNCYSQRSCSQERWYRNSLVYITATLHISLYLL